MGGFSLGPAGPATARALERQEALPAQEPSVLEVDAWERIVRRPHFDVYRIPTADGNFTVAKCARSRDDVFRQYLRKEFSALGDVHSRAGEVLAGTIPHPIFYREREGILLLSGIAGVSLEKKLYWQANVAFGWKNLQKMREIGHALGTWLRTFHQSTAWESQAHDHDQFLNVLERNLCRCRKVGLSETTLERVRSRAEKVSKSLEASVVRLAAAHGDFIPQNILMNGVRPGVIDFASYCAQAPVYRDLSAFLAYISLLAGKLKYSGGALEVLALGFLDAYGDRLDSRLVHIFVLQAMLRIIADNPDNACSNRGLRRVEGVLMEFVDGTSAMDRSIKRFLAG